MPNHKDPVRFGIIAEIHRAAAGSPRVSWHNEMLLDRTDELLALAIERGKSSHVDYLVLLGDLTNIADDESFSVVLSAVGDCGVPVLALPGNHDIDQHGALASFGDRLTAPDVSVAPAELRDTSGATIVLVAIERDAKINALKSSGFPDLRPYNGKPLLVFSHYPLLAMHERLSDAGLKHAGDLSDRQHIENLLLHHDGPVVVIHGHLHVRASAAEGNILHHSCAALVEPPHEVNIFSIDLDWQSRFVVGREAISVQDSAAAAIPVLSPPSESWIFEHGAWTR